MSLAELDQDLILSAQVSVSKTRQSGSQTQSNGKLLTDRMSTYQSRQEDFLTIKEPTVKSRLYEMDR